MENISLRKSKSGFRMFSKLSSEKISSTVCQGLRKEQKRNSDIYQIECRESKRGSLQGFWKEKARARATEKKEQKLNVSV